MMYEYVRPTYILINLLNILTMVYFGMKMSKAKSKQIYWSFAIYPMVTYAVCMGLRFGRMIDYNLYAERYIELGKNIKAHDYEFLFRFLCHAMYQVGLPYQAFVLVGSILMIYAVLFLLRDYRKAAPFILILFLYETYNIENYIRWYLGISFFLFFIVYLYRGDYIKYLLFAVIACLFHVGIIPLVIFCIILNRVRKNLISPVWVQLLFILSVYMGSIEVLSFLNPYIGLLGFDEKATGYADKFSQLINGEFGKVGIREVTRWTTQIRKILAYSFPIYIVPILLKKNKIRYLDANMFNLGIIIAPIFSQVEILDRYGSAFLLFSMIVSGYAYFYVLSRFKRFNIYIRIFFLLSLFAYVYPIFSDIFSRSHWYEMLFIWDAHGRDHLPMQQFMNGL